MAKIIRIFFTGMLVSFLGSLPLGTLNVAAMQIAVSDGVHPAFLFAFGSLTIEVIYVRVSLIAMDWIRKHEKIFLVLEWVTLAIVLALAASSFYAAIHPKVHKNFILSSTLNRYLLGLTMSAVNPVQIPFWFGWSTVLFSKKILLPKSSHYNFYIVGIGIGTLMASCVFIYGGKFIVHALNANEHMLHWIIGGIFTVTALIQVIKIIRKKDSVHQLEHPEQLTHGLEEKLLHQNKFPDVN